ncbi:MAG TPA: lytic transglycosylase domain-containing protein [Motilibacteraceae bacterium]|nr:lytic transglycosylase domain-containing protein [Motilibacteraceae bacterium]
MGARSTDRRGGRARAAAALLPLALAAGALAGPVPLAHAESADQARRAAQQAAEQVDALSPQLRAAVAAYDVALDGLARSTSRALSAGAEADDARRSLATAEAAHRAQVRALYMSGGTAGLAVTVLQAQSPHDLLLRLSSVQRVVAGGDDRVQQAQQQVAALSAAASGTTATAVGQVTTARDVEEQYARLQSLLAAAQARLDQLSARARSLEEAERAAAELRAAQLAADRSMMDRAARARAALPPSEYRALYQAAAPTCPGLPWSVLSAIGQVESGHGRNPGVSSAGAVGPMQFLPATFARYAVDGDRDGRADILSPADAIFTAARYLCANGAGSPAGLPDALWHYNHAQWYVVMVLRIAAQLDPASVAGVPDPTTPGLLPG